MDQMTRRALQFLRKIKSVSFATVNNGEPAVQVADVMLVGKDGIFSQPDEIVIWLASQYL